MSNHYDAAAQQKIKSLISQGVQVKEQVELLNVGLKETVAAIAEELDIKPKVLNKAISIAAKAKLQESKDEFDEVEEILSIAGRTL